MSGAGENPSPLLIFSQPPDAVPLPAFEGAIPLPPCASCGEDMCAHERMYEPPPGPPIEHVAIEAIADGRTYSATLDGVP